MVRGMEKLPEQMAQILQHTEEIQADCQGLRQVARTCSSSAATSTTPSRIEGSLKLKEISYIHSEAYASGELKHGTISLIEEGTLVIALGTYGPLFDKAMSNVVEVQARGAQVLALTTESHAGEMTKHVADDADHPRHGADAAAAASALCRCSCSRTTSRSSAAATSISPATLPRASR